jgi:hypothetical protein
MKWTLKLIAEFDSGNTMVHEVASLEREEAFIKPARLGMNIEESRSRPTFNLTWCLIRSTGTIRL